MTLRNSLVGALAVALALGATSTASAQVDTTRRDTTRRDTTARTGATSQQRVRVQKEGTTSRVTSPGDVAVPRGSAAARRDSLMRDSLRADSIARARRTTGVRTDTTTRTDTTMRTDTTARRDTTMRTDTTTTPTRTDTATTTVTTPPTRTDTAPPSTTPMMTEEQGGMMMMRGPWYLGLSAGPNVPIGDAADVYKAGFNVTVPIGWQPQGSPFGLRLDLSYSRFNGKELGAGASRFQADDPNIWSATVNATLDLVRWGLDQRGSLYVVGGGGAHRFSDFAETGFDGEEDNALKGEAFTKAGLSAGGGIAFPIGGASLFVESRWVTAFTENNNTNWVPIIVGLKWR